ncbi:FK506-binding protein 2 [Lactuca sativa]|uniref:FK506-binding protein 2 n=1 Tax=Lactuca sativa TaxID=4236 RepID=UPI000CBA1912|nr:FK506-binding protein 2 [Lactuca sativa]
MSVQDRNTTSQYTMTSSSPQTAVNGGENECDWFKPASCEIQAHKGDRVKVHYRGKLTDGTVFDSNFERGDPIEFELGTSQVIKGWDHRLLGMCVGEKRNLKTPSKLGYGDQGSPPTIPGGATLIFDTELVAVNDKGSGGGDTNNNSEL